MLLDVEDSMPICTEEIFGSVAPILTFTTEIELCLVGKNELSLVRSKSVRTYAQTNIQLFNQLRLAQYSEADLNYLCNIYDFALQIFTGCLRGSGKPFLSHLVGTASIQHSGDTSCTNEGVQLPTVMRRGRNASFLLTSA